ncbi:cullin, conserved site-containing protein, partial [Tanacetum coccineum]
ISGFDYECNDAYFDSALKFLHAASLLEAYYNDFSKLKGMVDPLTVYSTSAKLSKICAEEYEKRKEMAAAALAYKCMDVAYMRVVYCKSFVTKQDMQMVTQGESPSSSAFVVDNLNNQATIIDKTMLSKNITHLGNQVVARSQANFTRLLDFTSDVSLAMEASLSTQNAYKAASTTLEESQNKEMTISVKQVVDFSFQDVKELVTLVQNAREAINRQGFKGNDRQLSLNGMRYPIREEDLTTVKKDDNLAGFIGEYVVMPLTSPVELALLCLFITKDEALDKFKVFKTEVELQQVPLIKRFRTDRGGEYMDTLYFQSVSIIYETTTPYTLQQNGIFERKNKVLKEMVNSMLSYSGLSQGF